jgi:hypothetical protein
MPRLSLASQRVLHSAKRDKEPAKFIAPIRDDLP